MTFSLNAPLQMCNSSINFKCQSLAKVYLCWCYTQDEGISTSAAMSFNSEIVRWFDSKGLYLPLLTSSASFLGHPKGLPSCHYRGVSDGRDLQMLCVQDSGASATWWDPWCNICSAHWLRCCWFEDCCFHYFAVHIPPPLFNIHNTLDSIHFAGNWPHHLTGKGIV